MKPWSPWRLFLSLVLVLACFDAHATDPSICDSGSEIVFNQGGSLRSCLLKDNYRANGVTCQNFNGINFYEDGSLESCVLSSTSVVAGNRCAQFFPIVFYPDGRLRSCVTPVN